eukprot:CAMPEP_0173108228 /NCGR_PEP_ID=MMETSP1102-20130122/42515_1 /TAXON_ID=49646 /ORGANISM="Geminigera sp., Strain Caron Lab Isolate" /LENGTH=208 /DNA_ID=CAMNT_0014006503 /DNA_START=9 /DNA_END=635 /DNA_ORIENTATION=+
MAPVPEQISMEGQRGAGSQEGSTALGDLHNIKIVYNAEIRDLDCFQSLLLCWGSCGFMKYNTKRGYLYVRENSIEMNYALTWCQDGPCGLESTTDYIKVWYFDAPPLKKESKCFGCMPMEPKLEVIDSGCIILCQKCCADESAIVMPYERFCFCCTNRVGCCDNNCGTCGPITGNPKVFSAFLPQPKNAKAFVEAAQAVHKQKAGLTV